MSELHEVVLGILDGRGLCLLGNPDKDSLSMTSSIVSGIIEVIQRELAKEPTKLVGELMVLCNIQDRLNKLKEAK